MNPPGPSSSSEAPPSRPLPPPLPPRPGDASAVGMPAMNPQSIYDPADSGAGLYGAGMMGGYGGGYGGAPYSGGYGMYGGMGGYGGGYGGSPYGTGMPGLAPGGFANLAEESSRDTFRSIESVVNAVNAVANMLSSTHNAVYSSFRAVIGVVEQFGMLKTQLTSLLFSLWLFRWLRRFWCHLLVLLRLKPANYASVEELAWGEARLPLGTDVLASAVPSSAGTSMNWPAAMFWLVALGGPYLIYKSVTRMVEDARAKRQWAEGTGPHYTATTLFSFQGNNEQELSFMAGENLRVAPKEQQPRVRGWLLASSKEGDRIGLVPINYIRIISRQTTSPPPDRSATSLDNLNRAFQSALPPPPPPPGNTELP